LNNAFSANLAKAKDVRGSEEERASERETNDFSGFDRDFSGNVENVEDEREMRQDRRGAQRETIGAALWVIRHSVIKGVALRVIISAPEVCTQMVQSLLEPFVLVNNL
jgi:hypothetical protein